MHTIALFAVGFFLAPILSVLFASRPDRKQRAWDKLKARAEAENRRLNA